MTREPQPEDGHMGLFRLLAGKHVAKDATGAVREYNVGEVVESETDLADRHGHQKFIRVGGESESQKISRTPGDKAPGFNPEQFPGGQVSSGHQATAPVPDPEAPSETKAASGNAPEAVRKKLEAQEARTNAQKGDAPQAQPQSATLAALTKMNDKELREYAEDREIDVSAAKTREDVLRAIRAGK